MSDANQAVRRHYEPDRDDTGLVAQVVRIVDAIQMRPITPSRLAGLDQFHVGGLAMTEKLAALAGVESDMTVLDAGSGLGGPSRYLADVYGCHVVGADLTPSFVAASRFLGEKTGLHDLVSYEVADLSFLPFPDSQFNLVWTQHVVMNVRDRSQVYREFRRVLKPGGKLAFYDVLATDHRPALHFPVPWAEGRDTSFLLTEAETINAVELAGFLPGVWNDVTAEALVLMPGQRAAASDGLSLATVMGPRFADMSANLMRNLQEGAVRLVMGLCLTRDSPNEHAGGSS